MTDILTSGYMCKYAPIELLAGFGMTAELILPDESNFDIAESHIFPSICSYAKSVLQHSLKTPYDVILFTDCCDAMKRVADVLGNRPNQKIYQINLPRLNDKRGADLYADILERFIRKLEGELDRGFDAKQFLRACSNTAEENADGGYIGIIGARISPSLLDECRSLCRLPVRDLTCASQERCFGNLTKSTDDICSEIPSEDTCKSSNKASCEYTNEATSANFSVAACEHPNKTPNADITENTELSALLRIYADALLSQMPCLRMADTSARKELFNDPHLKGIIYHTIKFCDFYSFEYAAMEKRMPILKLETDFTPACTGQVRTRMEAFFEATGTQKESITQPSVSNADDNYFAGVDIGSTSTEAVILNSGGKIAAQIIVPTGAKSMDAANLALDKALEQSGLDRRNITNMITTGYGRKAVSFDSKDITEISCHAKAVSHQFPQARSIIDIGGQDSKVIRLNTDGSVADFAMNDKCAAGTGRFLELMSATLGLSLARMSELGLRWHEEVTISSMCAVFAESEVISLIAQNKETCDIIRGINLSIASRVAGLVARIRAEGPFVMTGGVAKNRGVLLALEQKLGEPILIPDEPQICGALGAALFAAAAYTS